MISLFQTLYPELHVLLLLQFFIKTKRFGNKVEILDKFGADLALPMIMNFSLFTEFRGKV